MKLTEDPEKQTLPGSKAAFRLLGPDGEAPPCCPPQGPRPPRHSWGPPYTGALLLDVLQLAEEPPPRAGQELRVWPRGAQESRTVRPAQVETLLQLWVRQGQVTTSPTPSSAPATQTQP